MDYPRSYGPYTLLERLGRGGMSDVDLARQSVESASYVRFVVIKRLRSEMTTNPDYVRMFQDEARINAELQHANIAQVYSFGQTDGEYFLAMEYIAGADLREMQKALLTSGRRLPTPIALRIVVDVLSALSYAHSRVDTYGRPMRIVHRDVNPRNIMLSSRGEVKLIDFGVAKADNRIEETVRHTFKGKFAYMAPEQIQEDTPVDQRADLYAIGLVLHELINGSSPFAGLGDIQIMQRVLTGRISGLVHPPDTPDPAPLRAVHQRALKINPEERYQTADEMRLAVIAAAEESGGIASDEALIGFFVAVLPDAVAQRQELEAYRDDSPSTLVAPNLPSDDATISVLMETPDTIRPMLLGALMGLSSVLLVALVFAVWPDPPPPIVIEVPVLVEPPPPPAPIPSEVILGEVPEVLEVRPTKKKRPPSEVPQVVEPPPEEPEVLGSGRISVANFPASGLDVLLDGEQIGETPIRHKTVPAGEHTIEVVDPGGEGWVKRITIIDGQALFVEAPR